MGRITGNKPMFDEDDVKRATEPNLQRLIRIIFYGLGITNEGYLARYSHYFREVGAGDKTQKEHSQKAASDRKFILDPRKLSINMFRNVMMAMGSDIEEISVTLRDRLTGESRKFSTSDTVEDLKKAYEKSQEVGIDSIE